MSKDFLKDFKSIKGILFSPIRGSSHGERLENFYREQAGSYDNFRNKLLQGRREIMAQLKPQVSGVWIDFGAGTGQNLDFIGEAQDQFEKVYLVDLSRSLLSQAQKRIESLGWKNAKTVETDCRDFEPAESKADFITFSYSLSMMPNWIEVLDHAIELLRPGGTIGVVDYYLSRKHDPHLKEHDWLTRHFWRMWFEKDNVFLNGDHVHYLKRHLIAKSFEENLAPLPYLPWMKVPYYQFIGEKPLADEKPLKSQKAS